MRKIYQKYFEIPEENTGTMSEHVFFARLTVAIACIVLCMGAMGFSAYAFFTVSVSSNMNQIQAANFSLSVQSPIKLVIETGSVAVDSTNPNKYTMTQPGIYDFTLVKSGSASTGYCEIVIMKDENTVVQSICTRQFGKSTLQDTSVDTRTVRIEVSEETIVKFVPCWGTHSMQEMNRFDEQTKMIVVDDGTTVKLEDISTSRGETSTEDTNTE